MKTLFTSRFTRGCGVGLTAAYGKRSNRHSLRT